MQVDRKDAAGENGAHLTQFFQECEFEQVIEGR